MPHSVFILWCSDGGSIWTSTSRNSAWQDQVLSFRRVALPCSGAIFAWGDGQNNPQEQRGAEYVHIVATGTTPFVRGWVSSIFN